VDAVDDDLCAQAAVRVWPDAGPSHWADAYQECGGRSQSPINIEPSKTTQKDIGNFTLTGYDAASDFDLENNGHTGIANSAYSFPSVFGVQFYTKCAGLNGFVQL